MQNRPSEHRDETPTLELSFDESFETQPTLDFVWDSGRAWARARKRLKRRMWMVRPIRAHSG